MTKMTILIRMTVCIRLNTQRVKVHQTEHSRMLAEEVSSRKGLRFFLILFVKNHV